MPPDPRGFGPEPLDHAPETLDGALPVHISAAMIAA